jgi:hypothetical protein
MDVRSNFRKPLKVEDAVFDTFMIVLDPPAVLEGLPESVWESASAVRCGRISTSCEKPGKANNKANRTIRFIMK